MQLAKKLATSNKERMTCCWQQSAQASAVHQVFYYNLMCGSELLQQFDFAVFILNLHMPNMAGHFIYCATLLSDNQ